jgi:hypothetical protein
MYHKIQIVVVRGGTSYANQSSCNAQQTGILHSTSPLSQFVQHHTLDSPSP